MSFTKQTLSHLPDGKEGLNYGQALPETDQTEHVLVGVLGVEADPFVFTMAR